MLPSRSAGPKDCIIRVPGECREDSSRGTGVLIGSRD